jgi:outer membrane protein assembly factor BamB
MITALALSIVLQSETKVVPLWTTRLQTEIQSHVVGERAIYFGTNDSFGAIDQNNGKKVWAKSVKAPQLGVFIAEGDGMLFASVGQGNLGAFNATTGKPIWSLKRTGYASPIGYYNRSLYAELASGKLTAFNANGKSLWSAALGKSTLSTKPIRYGKAIFAGTKTGAVTAFDKDTGKQVWQSNERQSGVQALLIAGERLVATFDDGSVLGLSLETGQRMWAVYTNNGLFGTPLLRDGRIYVTSVSGRFYSIAAENGQELWVRSLSTRQNFGLTQPMPWQSGFLIGDHAKLVHLDEQGERKWELDGGLELVGNQPRTLAGDVLLVGSHEIRRVRINSAQ